MTPAPLGPSGVVKIMAELIDAQARHIEQLERGRWTRDTAEAVQEKRDELAIVQAVEDHPIKPCSNPDCPLPYAHNGPCAPAGWIDPATGKPHKPDHICNQACRDAKAAAKEVRKGDFIGYAGNTGETLITPALLNYYDQQNTPAADYLAAYARLQAAAATAPEHENLRWHTEAAWAPKGVCARCDLLQPLQDAEQRLHQALIRHNHGIPPEGVNREAGIQHDGYGNSIDVPPPHTEQDCQRCQPGKGHNQ
jgi:hypothetical protein